MAWFALSLLVLWPVVVLLLFERYPVRKAIITSFVLGWLFLPPIGIPLPGVPDWTKASATTVSVLVALLLKQPGPLLGFRPRWFDLPILLFCLCPVPSSVSGGTGAYEGISWMLEDFLWWGFPYLIGRAYLSDADGARQLVTGFVAGALLYVPLCLFEIRMSPILKHYIFNVASMSVTDFGLRYGGYRPAVFLASGLEVGWWMCCASFCAYALIAGRSSQRWFGLPVAPLGWALALTTIACKSTGALVQIAIGFLLVKACRMSKSTIPLWLLLPIAPIYCLARPSGFCSGEQIISLVAQVFPADRIQSLGYRFSMEDYLIGNALQHPILGWSRAGDFNPVNEQGHAAAVADGYWIMMFCCKGAIGLVLLNTMSLLPTALFLRRYPVRSWLTAQVAPLMALATILPLCLIDNLSNAMINPIYPIAMAALAGCSTGRREAFDNGSDDEAGDDDANEAELVAAIRRQEHAARARPHSRNVEHLASLRAQHARLLALRGRSDLALAERAAAENLWRAAEPASAEARPWHPERATNANNLAWLLASEPGGDPSRLEQARRLIEAALAGDPTATPFWNTLGIVCYRQGEHHRAIHALSRSVTLDPDGGTAFDFYFLALANQALGYGPAAGTWGDRAEAWFQAHPEMGPALAEVRAEFLRVRTSR